MPWMPGKKRIDRSYPGGGPQAQPSSARDKFIWTLRASWCSSMLRTYSAGLRGPPCAALGWGHRYIKEDLWCQCCDLVVWWFVSFSCNGLYIKQVVCIGAEDVLSRFVTCVFLMNKQRKHLEYFIMLTAALTFYESVCYSWCHLQCFYGWN